MTTSTHPVSDYRYKTGSNRLGLWLFIISDAFMFGGLLVARYALWGNTRPELNQTLGLLVTAVLLISSFFMNRAELAMQFGDRKYFLRNMAITIVLGILFIVGVVGIEWPTAPVKASENVYGAIFYIMTGMHAFHVLTGVILLLVIFNNGRKGLYTSERHWAVEAGAVYWHFVDVVWIFFYPALYLIGSLAG